MQAAIVVGTLWMTSDLVCSPRASGTLILDMARLDRLERLQLAAIRLREIQRETAGIYRRFPELDPRPTASRGPVRATSTHDRRSRVADWPVKFH